MKTLSLISVGLMLTFSSFLPADNNLRLPCAPPAKCVGSTPCRACRNCSACGHCNSGGSCGICVGGRPNSSGGKSEVNASAKGYSLSALGAMPFVFQLQKIASLRRLPNEQSMVVARLAKGAELSLLSLKGGWAEVRVKATLQTGYLSAAELGLVWKP